jgi:hypothetical protein
MKLQELAAPNPTQQIAQVFESYFGSRITVEQLNQRQTVAMLNRVRGLINEHQSTVARHHSEQNPGYLKLVVMEKALCSKLEEFEQPAMGQPNQQQQQQQQQQTQKAVSTIKDPKLKAALDKSAKGQNLNPEEQKMVAGAALMKTETKLRNAFRIVKESEVQQAQVVLAAQDLVDKMQGMLEDTTELQFKELPALVDSIKNQVGIDQAQQFNTDASAALAGLVQNLQGAKQQLETALGVVTGQTPAAPALDAAMAGAEPAVDADLDAELDANLEVEPGEEALPAEEPEEPVAGGKGAFGRARR